MQFVRWIMAPKQWEWRPPFYVRLWNGLMQVAIYRRLPVYGASTPGHSDRHRFWLAFENPLFGSRCWWCGLQAYPGVAGYRLVRAARSIGVRTY